ncbi:AlkZ-related protein [Segatella copri]|uniref:AlkZ-related protein n=1 Tax=Segatella copri TaxID=165179 RepID=UPI003F713017
MLCRRHRGRGCRYATFPEGGWDWPLVNTPEELYGRETCQCNRTPEESYQRNFEHLKEILPDASDKQIIKLIGEK